MCINFCLTLLLKEDIRHVLLNYLVEGKRRYYSVSLPENLALLGFVRKNLYKWSIFYIRKFHLKTRYKHKNINVFLEAKTLK